MDGYGLSVGLFWCGSGLDGGPRKVESSLLRQAERKRCVPHTGNQKPQKTRRQPQRDTWNKTDSVACASFPCSELHLGRNAMCTPFAPAPTASQADQCAAALIYSASDTLSAPGAVPSEPLSLLLRQPTAGNTGAVQDITGLITGCSANTESPAIITSVSTIRLSALAII